MPVATGWAQVLRHVKPDDTQIVVVEQHGQIIGCWGVMRVVHLEGLWIDPAFRGRVSVARRLYQATLAVARKFTTGWAMTGAQTDDVRRMLTRIGAEQIPMDVFVMPLEGVCQSQL